MSDVSELINEVYGTSQGAEPQITEEDQEKIAQAEFFNNLCAEQGIDIDALSDDQVERLYKSAMAAYSKPEDDGEQQKQQAKEAAALEEFQEKRAAVEKIAEVDALGRIMAHAYVDELRKIAQEGEAGPLAPPKPPAKKEEEEEEEEEGEEEKKESQARAEALIAALNKNASASTTPNLDEIAANDAFALLKEAGFSEEVAAARLNAVLTLGLGESEKIAAAQTPDQARYVRALEFCEAAGFPVEWPAG